MLPIRVAVANELPPSWKVAVPVGTPAPGDIATTVAVNVTDCPTIDGLSEEVIVVPDPDWLTTCMIKPEPMLKFASPLYCATTGCDPGPNVVVV